MRVRIVVNESVRSTLMRAGSTWMRAFGCGLVAVSVLGCSSLQRPIPGLEVIRPTTDTPQFPQLYASWVPKPLEEKAAADRPRITISAQGMDCAAFCREIARQAGLSIVVAEGIENRTLTMEIRNQPIDDVL